MSILLFTDNKFLVSACFIAFNLILSFIIEILVLKVATRLVRLHHTKYVNNY